MENWMCLLCVIGLNTVISEYEEISDFSDKLGWKSKLESYTGCSTSINQCVNSCCLNAFCSSFFYNYNSGRCQLHYEVLNDTSSTIISSGSRYYRCQKDLCPEGWYPYNGNCYLIKTDMPMNWTTAMDYCKQVGGFLAEIKSQNEHVFTVKLLHLLGAFDTSLWLGGTDQETEGTWRWESNNEEMTYTAWDPNQPDDYLSDEDFLSLSKWGYKWNDLSLNRDISFICQKDSEVVEANCCRNTTI